MAGDAKYHQEYRKKQKQEMAEERAEAIRQGVALACRFMRMVIAGRAVTGYQAAKELERAMLPAPAPGVAERQALIAITRPITSR